MRLSDVTRRDATPKVRKEGTERCSGEESGDSDEVPECCCAGEVLDANSTLSEQSSRLSNRLAIGMDSN